MQYHHDPPHKGHDSQFGNHTSAVSAAYCLHSSLVKSSACLLTFTAAAAAPQAPAYDHADGVSPLRAAIWGHGRLLGSRGASILP